MRITFVQSGGFTGAIKGCRCDTAALGADDRRTVESLVAASGLAGRCERYSDTGRDLRQYEIVIEGAETTRLCCDERSLPEAARPLVTFLAARAVPQRPDFAAAVAASGGAVDPAVRAAPENWGRFVGTVVARWSDDGRDMTLVEPFAYVDLRDLRWDAPTGAVVNGASIPQAFWSLIGGPFEGRFRNASVVHDVACEVRGRPWQDVHRMFYEACRCGGVGAVMAKTMYYAVHHFGPRWRVEERATIVAGRSVVERTVHDETPPPATPGQAAAVERYFRTHEVAAAAIPTLAIPREPPSP